MHINKADLPKVAAILAEADQAAPPVRFPAAPMPPDTSWHTIEVVLQWEDDLRHDRRALTPAAFARLPLAAYWREVVMLFEVYRQITHYPDPPVDPGHAGAATPRAPMAGRAALAAAHTHPGREPAMTRPAGMDWSRWSVILLKPDCLARGLVEPVLGWVRREIQVSGLRVVEPTEEQIFAHYDDILDLSARLGVDVPGELRRIYVGQQVAVALGYGTQAAARLRAILGDTDPAAAGPDTIRGHFGDDSLRAARAQGQLINNLIHTSDNAAVVPRDFDIWYSTANAHLLTTAPCAAQPAIPAPRNADRHHGRKP